MSKQEISQRVRNILQLMQIEEYASRFPNEISGGQQQRVALARAVVTEPSVLLFDEPLSNLDAKLREYMREELRKIQKRVGITSLYVTHDQSEAMAISDKVIIMQKGTIEQAGTAREIYARPKNKFVAGFIGKANFIKPDEVHSVSGGRAEITLLGKRITAFHIHDNDGRNDQHLAPYMGVLDWERFIAAVRDIGYDKTLSFETFNVWNSVHGEVMNELMRFIAACGRMFARRIAEN